MFRKFHRKAPALESLFNKTDSDTTVLRAPSFTEHHLILASDRVVLYGNVAFSFLVPSPKKQYSSFLRKLFIFQKICFKNKISKAFKISSDCHMKIYRSLKRRTSLKIPPSIAFSEEPMLFLLAIQ